MIEFDRVSVGFRGGAQALVDVSLKVEAQTLTFLTGHSGAGKSTLLKVLLGLVQPNRGSVKVNDVDLASLSGRHRAAYRRGVGVVLQTHQLLADRSAIENVCVPLRLLGHSQTDAERRGRAALRSVELGEKAERLPMHLSTGERQRLGLARAIAHRPRLLVADEPTGNLDPALSAEMMNLLDRFHRLAGTTVIVATHELSLISRYPHPVVELSGGRLVPGH